MLSRFHLIPESNGRTDGRTDLLYQMRVSMLTRDKNVVTHEKQPEHGERMSRYKCLHIASSLSVTMSSCRCSE